MRTPRSLLVPRLLGILTLVFALIAAGFRYNETGEIRWSLVAAGVFFASIAFAIRKAGPPPSR